MYKQIQIYVIFDQVDNFLLVDQWASLAILKWGYPTNS